MVDAVTGGGIGFAPNGGEEFDGLVKEGVLWVGLSKSGTLRLPVEHLHFPFSIGFWNH